MMTLKISFSEYNLSNVEYNFQTLLTLFRLKLGSHLQTWLEINLISKFKKQLQFAYCPVFQKVKAIRQWNLVR